MKWEEDKIEQVEWLKCAVLVYNEIEELDIEKYTNNYFSITLPID